MISSGFSKQGCAAIFVLAYHLKAPRAELKEEYVFKGAETLNFVADRLYSKMPDRVIFVLGPREPIVATENVEKEAAVYAYIAAFMIRIFRKSHQNYVKAWNHIIDGYAKFYCKPTEIRLPVPTEAAINGLANWFSIDAKAKVTLYRLLHMSNANDHHLGLKRFLYDIHLANTGMHILNIIVQLCKILNCTLGVILAAINCGQNARQVDCLVRLLGILKSTSEENVEVW